uniref:Copper homeostasis protein cutC homolog n=1 Tax=Caenorhabditis japonica TaxID=281687 RepID=A0A8R1DLS8_CAEJA
MTETTMTETAKKPTINLEICIDNMESADNAVAGGADRLEVCSALALGGLTPSVGFVATLHCKYPHVPLYCMLRQRAGNFVYTHDEMDSHIEEIEWLKKAGASGFVFGALTETGTLDRYACEAIVETAGSLPVTFHRAIDVAYDWKSTLEDAIDVGFKRWEKPPIGEPRYSEKPNTSGTGKAQISKITNAGRVQSKDPKPAD